MTHPYIAIAFEPAKPHHTTPHPFPEKLILDEDGQPVLSSDASHEDWVAHDRWLAESCEHGGLLLSARLGNISMVVHIREFLGGLQRKAGSHFPLLLEKVVYSATHSGDSIPSAEAPQLLKEVDTVLPSGDILDPTEREFFTSMK